MARTIREVMTPDPVAMRLDDSIAEAARHMRDYGIGDVLAVDNDMICVVTDRDIVVRAVADNRNPSETTLRDVCTANAVVVNPGDRIDDAVRTMRELAIRRLPVVENGRLVGVVTIGDMAISEDSRSALADISAAPPNV